MTADFSIGTITPFQWREVLQAAAPLLDINKGGYADGRSGVVNFWCGPEDKPAGWPDEVEIRWGALDYPRSFVASVWMQWPEDSDANWSDVTNAYPVEVDITCYDVQEWRKKQPAFRRRLSVEERAAMYRVDGDVAWVAKQWQRLLEHARHAAAREARW